MGKEQINVQISINEWRNLDKLTKLPRDKTYKFELVEEAAGSLLKKKSTLGSTEPDIFENNNKDKLDAYKIGAVLNFQVELEKVGNKYKEKKLRLNLLWGSKGAKAWSSQSIKPNEYFQHEGELNSYDREESCKFEKATSYLLYTINIWPADITFEEAKKKANDKGLKSIKSFAQSTFNLKLPPEGFDLDGTSPLPSPHPDSGPLSERGEPEERSGSISRRVTDGMGSMGSMGSFGSMVFEKEEDLPEVYIEARKEYLKKAKQDTNSSIESLKENIALQEKRAESMPEIIKESLDNIEKEMEALHKEKKKAHRKLEDSMEDIESEKIEVVSKLDEWKAKKQKADSENYDLLNPLEKKQTELKVMHDKMEGQKKNATLLLTQKLTTSLVASQNEIGRISKLIETETQQMRENKEDTSYMTSKIEEFKLKINDLESMKKKANEQKDQQISKIKNQNLEKEKEIKAKESVYIKSLAEVQKEYDAQKKILDKSTSENMTMKKELKPLKESILTHEMKKLERIEKNVVKNASKIVELKIHDALNKSEEKFVSTLQNDKSKAYLQYLNDELKKMEADTKPLQKEFEQLASKRIELAGKLLLKRKKRIDSADDLEKRKLYSKYEHEDEIVKLSRMPSIEEMKSALEAFDSECSSNKKVSAIKMENYELKQKIFDRNPEKAYYQVEDAETSISQDTAQIAYQQIKIQENEKRLKEIKDEIQANENSDFNSKLSELKEKVDKIKKLAKEKADAANSLERTYQQKLNSKRQKEKKVRDIENEIDVIDKFTRQTGESREVKLNVIKITDSVEEAEYIIEPLISLKGGITKFLKEVNKKCLELKGRTISDILATDDSINDRIDHLILKPFIHIFNHGFLINQWYFTTGHIWRMFEDILQTHEKLYKIFNQSIKLVDTDIKKKHRDGLTTTKIYDHYLRAFLVICMEEKLLTSVVDAITDPSKIETYYQHTAILHIPNDVIKLKKIIAVLSKIPFQFTDKLFFMQEQRKLKSVGTMLYHRMQTRYTLNDVDLDNE